MEFCTGNTPNGNVKFYLTPTLDGVLLFDVWCGAIERSTVYIYAMYLIRMSASSGAAWLHVLSRAHANQRHALLLAHSFIIL